jgi:hypothetical protein
MNNCLLFLIISLLIILLVFYFLNMQLSKLGNKNKNEYAYRDDEKEHFLDFLQYVNDGFNPKIKENTEETTKIMNTNKMNNFDDIFLKNIYLSYNESSKKYSFYILNYDYKLLMTIFVKKDKSNFDIINNNINEEINKQIDNKEKNKNIELKNKELIGFLKTKKHNNYILDLQKLYKNDYNFVILDNYNTIKIYTEFEYDVFYLKKNLLKNNDGSGNGNNGLNKYKLYVFNDEIGHINYDNKNYKISIKKKYLKYIYLFSYALIILISNNET